MRAVSLLKARAPSCAAGRPERAGRGCAGCGERRRAMQTSMLRRAAVRAWGSVSSASPKRLLRNTDAAALCSRNAGLMAAMPRPDGPACPEKASAASHVTSGAAYARAEAAERGAAIWLRAHQQWSADAAPEHGVNYNALAAAAPASMRQTARPTRPGAPIIVHRRARPGLPRAVLHAPLPAPCAGARIIVTASAYATRVRA